MYINGISKNFNTTTYTAGSNSNSAQNNSAEKSGSGSKTDKKIQDKLTPHQKKIIEYLKARDMEVKNHEMAHIAAGGSYIRRGAKYQYEKGPDGILYAVSGDVLIDTSPIPGNPRATISKMDTIINAALAPANPSAADKAIASQASSSKIKAQDEIIKLQLEKTNIEKNSSNNNKTSNYLTEKKNIDKGFFLDFSV
ncbi:MAG: SprA-related family protein [Deltaproteobacteria bacterium]|nr:MAG: SprA-related family protein [Deltaproteobacteria bacterium]